MLRALLSEIGLDAWLKTSGGKGLHVLVPLRRQHGWETTKDFSAALVRHLAQAWPQLFVAKSGPQPGGQDLRGLPAQRLWRDDRGALVGAGAAGLPISVPISWDELEQVRGAHWTIRTRGSDWISAIVPGMGMRRRPWAGHGGAWFASVVKARRRRAAAASRARQGASDFFIEGAGCRT